MNPLLFESKFVPRPGEKQPSAGSAGSASSIPAVGDAMVLFMRWTSQMKRLEYTSLASASRLSAAWVIFCGLWIVLPPTEISFVSIALVTASLSRPNRVHAVARLSALFAVNFAFSEAWFIFSSPSFSSPSSSNSTFPMWRTAATIPKITFWWLSSTPMRSKHSLVSPKAWISRRLMRPFLLHKYEKADIPPSRESSLSSSSPAPDSIW